MSYDIVRHMDGEKARYPHLFSPIDIGPVRARNRFMQSTHSKIYARDGADSQRTIDYCVERAKGGVGLLFTDAHLVHPTSSVGMPRKTWGFLPQTVAASRRLTSAVKEHGAAVFTQLVHNGINALSDTNEDLRCTWGPSAVRSPLTGEIPKAMEVEDIQEVVEAWGVTAEQCREGGFDGVEIHLGHDYLLHEFWSPKYNKRTDGYGGSWENRTRFAREVIAEVRRRTGRDWAVGVRMSAGDFLPGALDVRDAVRMACELEAAGEVDFINVTAAGYPDFARMNAPSDTPDGYFVELAAEIKANVERLPVFVVGGIKEPAHAEAIVAEGKADVIAMARALLADPELPNKARDGREDEIVRCIRGNQGCMGRILRGMGAGCTVNPAAGREARLGVGTLRHAAASGRWLVVGGGPAGMRAASTLAARGHDVTLRERTDRLGGQVDLILRTPKRETFRHVTEDLERRMRRHGVAIELATEATADAVVAEPWDGVVVATGAVPTRTGFSMMNPMVDRLPGADQDNVVTPWDVLLETRPVGERVVVLDDDGTRSTAGVLEVLLDRGHRVELVTGFPQVLPNTLGTLDMAPLYQRLFAKGLTYRINAWVLGIDGTTVQAIDLYTGTSQAIEGVDTLVLCLARAADEELYLSLKGRVPNVHRIGDCVAPRRIDHAIHEGELAGRELWTADERYLYDGELERAA